MTALLALLAIFGHHHAAAPKAAPPAPAPALPAAAPVAEPSPIPPAYYAVGGWRPSWRLDIAGGTLRFQRGRELLTAPAPEPTIHYNGLEWNAEGAFGGIRIVQWHERCVGAKRQPYGDTVRITLNKRRFSGCGGPIAPNGQRDQLDGGHWRLETIDGQRIGREADVTLSFSRGRVIGRAGCNAFGATYTLTPASLHFDTAISTEMSCSVGREAVEHAVFSLLGQTMTIRVRGARLTLVSADRHVARFRLLDPHKFNYAVEWKRKPVK